MAKAFLVCDQANLTDTDFNVFPDCYEASEPLPVQPEEAA